MKFKAKGKIKTGLDMTPLIDTVFLLLIFFLLTSSFLVQPGIKVKLPATESSESQLSKDLILTITKDNDIYLNERKVSLKNLSRNLKLALKKSKERLLIVKADKRVLHGKVVEIMDIAKGAGIDKLAIGTESKKEKSRE
jgi:biopolymer transport protein ExbD